MRFFSCILSFFLFNSSHATEVHVAVAANFTAPMQQISVAFQQATGHKAILAFGATGKFYAQIKNGAPFDILLAADQMTPTKLAQENVAIADSQFTYAIGKLVLWSATENFVDAQGAVLKSGKFAHIAIASPQAPYGVAAKQTLMALNLLNSLLPKIVQGESIGQTYSFVASGNAELGLVALSQVWKKNKINSGSAWIVPDNLYTPLRQDAILLKTGEHNPAARELLSFLKSDAAKKIIQSYGYHDYN
jgi:molybdate transport system substrate-binding protein